jgi:crossover junction endodeoxyribonuclease RusA
MNKATLPVPPSVNHYLRRTRWGVTLTEEAKAFKDYVRYNVRKRMLTGDVVMRIDYYRKRRAGDIDGPLKLCFDALQGIWYENDKQIVELHVRRFEDRDNPRLEITCTNK